MRAFRESTLFAADVEPGKQGLKAEHRSKVCESPGVRCLESIDFDHVTTRQKMLPNYKRWDYFLAISGSPDRLLALEVHPFKESELVQKRSGTLAILRKYCPEAEQTIDAWHVVVTNEMRSDSAQRFAAEHNIRLHRIFTLSRKRHD